MANDAIRNRAKEVGVKLWEVADFFKMADSTFSRQMRRELPYDKQQHILSAIDRISEIKAEQKQGV
ncbi:MAG: hypothetical protein Q4E38_03670 [Eubacteriales bacterium]|nr:hypothetical protein [Eubacteriales bacterium]